MKKITKIESAIKRKVKENRLRRGIRTILNNSLPSILAEMDQLDQAFLDAKPVNEARTYRLGDKWSNDFDYKGMLQMGTKARVSTGLDKLQKLYDSFEDVNYHSENQDLGNAIDWLEDEGPNHPKVKQFMNRFRQACLKTLRGLKEGKLKFERAYASTDGKPYFDYDPGEGKLTEGHIPQIADEKKYTAEFRKKYGTQKTNKFLSFEIEPLAGSGYFNYRDIAKLAKQNKFGIWDTVRLVNAAYVNQVKGVPMNVKNEGKLTESMIGIKTKANFKPLQLKGALERAGIKGYQMNRLSVTLTALKIDKKYFKDAKKIIDSLGLSVMTAKESVNEYGGSEFSKITSLQNFLTIDLDKFEKGLKDSKHKNIYKKARKQFMKVVSDVAWEHSKLYEGKLTEGRPGTTKKKYDVGDIIWVTIPGAGGGTFKGKVVEIGVVRGKFVYRVKDGRSQFAAHHDEVRGLDEGKALKKVVDSINSDKQPLVEYKKLNKMQAKTLVALFGLSILGFTFKAAAAPLFVLFAGAMHINDFLEAKKYVKNNPEAAKQAHLKFDQYDNKIRGFM